MSEPIEQARIWLDTNYPPHDYPIRRLLKQHWGIDVDLLLVRFRTECAEDGSDPASDDRPTDEELARWKSQANGEEVYCFGMSQADQARLVRAYEAAIKEVKNIAGELTAHLRAEIAIDNECDALRQQLATAQARVAELDELKTTLTNATTLLQRICAARDSDVPATDEEWYTLCDDCDLFLTGLAGVLCPNCQTVGDHSTGDGGWSCETPSYHTIAIASLQIEVRRLRQQLAAAQARIAELEAMAPGQLAREQYELYRDACCARDALREQLAARDAEIAAENAEIATLRDRIAVLLRKYGVHLSSCRTHHREVGMPSLATDCDCGLQSIIDGLQREAAVAARDGSR